MNSLKADGVIGLGFPDPKHPEYSNFITQLQNQGVIPLPKFSLYFSSSNLVESKLFIGDFSQGTLLSPFYKQMSYCQVDKSDYKWGCNLQQIEVNKNKREVSSKLNIDSGSSFLTIPIADFQIIKKFLIDNTKAECIRNESNQLLCKCANPTIFPDIHLIVGASNLFTIQTQKIINYYPALTYQCRFAIIIDMDNDDTWTLGTSVLANSLFSFDMNARKIGFIQNNIELHNLMRKDTLILPPSEDQDGKIVYVFVLGAILLILYATVKFANEGKFMSSKRSNSFDYSNMEDKKRVEMLKNKFNEEGYDFDDVNNFENKKSTNNKKTKHHEYIELNEIK
jgi:hypothetical protein